MQGGDISNEMSPRVLVVVDKLVFDLAPEHKRYYTAACRLRRYNDALARMTVNHLPLAYIKDLCWRHHLSVDAATFEGHGVGQAMQRYFDSHNVGISYTQEYDSPSDLGQMMAYLPEVRRVIHADPRVQSAVGPRGYYVGEGANINGALF